MGPRNPVEGGFSLELRSRWSEDKVGTPETGTVRPRASAPPDAFVSLSKDAAAGRAAQARRPEGRTMAGGRWRASCASPVVSRSVSGSSLDRGITRPFGALSPPPTEVGTDRRKRRPPSRRTPSEWAGERSAPIATAGPSEAGGWRRVGRSPTRPVLKHGPRSLTCARVNGS